MLPAVVAILIAIIAGGILLYFFYLRKPAKKAVPPPNFQLTPDMLKNVASAPKPPEDEVEITEEELASLKDIPKLQSELSEIKKMLRSLSEPEPEPEPEPPPEEWEEVEVKPGIILKMRKNGHMAEAPEEKPKETPAERMARVRAAKNRDAKKAQEGP